MDGQRHRGYTHGVRPRLAITLGDPAGIGPEITGACLESAAKLADLVLFGHPRSIDSFPKTAGSAVDLAPVADKLDPGDEEGAGGIAMAALKAGVDAVLEGSCDGIVTAPVSKASIALVSPGFTGHTEYLASRAALGRDDVTMAFASERLTVGLVTTHVPVRDLAATITRERYERTTRHVISLARRLGGAARPVIGVAGFNPHAGEDGVLGREELDVIGPFCRDMGGSKEAEVRGPIPADTVYRDALAGKYDAVVAAYHDQAMIPLKLAGTGTTVNVTMGLPFVRTSPDHGTARDIAGKGIANPAGMAMAIEYAARLCSGSNRER